VSRLDELADQYERYIAAPWQRNLAGAQRIIFIVYPKEDERRLRIKVKEFEHRTKAAGHGWFEVDFTSVFPAWMSAEEYRDEYFRHPEDLQLKLDTEFAEHCTHRLQETLANQMVTAETVVALSGVSSLYGFTRLHGVLHKVENQIQGRLVVFFPGSFDQNVYRLLDARDGWNYLATPITA